MPQALLNFLSEHFYIPLYLLAWLLSVYAYRRYFDTALKYLPILIAYTFFTELLGFLIKENYQFQFFSESRYAWHNVIIYNVYQLIFFLFFFKVYSKVIISNQIRLWIKYGSYVCILAYIANSFFKNPLHNQLAFGHVVGSTILMAIIVVYFRQKAQPENPYSKWRNLMFWVSLGLVGFYVLFPVILVVSHTKFDIYTQFYYRNILLSCIIMMYACFIMGFLIGKRKAFR